jgi:hypothetical protein
MDRWQLTHDDAQKILRDLHAAGAVQSNDGIWADNCDTEWWVTAKNLGVKSSVL